MNDEDCPFGYPATCDANCHRPLGGDIFSCSAEERLDQARCSAPTIPEGSAAFGSVVFGQNLVVKESYRMLIDVRFEVGSREDGCFEACIVPKELGYDSLTDLQHGTGVGRTALEAVRAAQVDLLRDYLVEKLDSAWSDVTRSPFDTGRS